MDREEFILSFLKYAERLAYKYKRYVEFDDITQEAMLVVCQIVSQSHNLDNPEAYICTSMKNAVYLLLGNSRIIKPEFAVRHRHHEGEMVIDRVSLSRIDEDTIPEERENAQEDWQYLYDLVDLLSPMQRSIIGYHFGLVGYGKLSMHEIAEKLGYSSIGTISGAINRALLNLRKQLDQSYRATKRRNEQLRSARLAHGWTTAETGLRLGMATPRNYERWERGARPSEENRAKLCDLFAMTELELGFSAIDANERREQDV